MLKLGLREAQEGLPLQETRRLKKQQPSVDRITMP